LHHTCFSELVPKVLINSVERRNKEDVIMRHHDLVSDGFLALAAAGFVLLCSSLIAFAFA
jgi:hypothetical protein